MKNIETHKQSTASAFDSKNGPKEEGMRINGLQQVVEMLEHADPAFRESLLRRLTQRDPKLAQNLRKIIR